MRGTRKGSCIIREKSSKANDKLLPSFFSYYSIVKSKQERIAVCGLTFPFATAT